MKFYELWYLFSSGNSAKDTFITYSEYLKECSEHQLDVITCDKNIPINIPIFSEIMAIPNVITIFNYPNLGFFSPSIVKNMQNMQTAPLKIDYSISFESNTGSYIHEFLAKGDNATKPPKGFVKILHTILENNYNIDPIFYFIENSAKGNESSEFIDNLESIKKLMTCDMDHYYQTKQIISIYSDDQIKSMVREDLNHLKNEFSEVITVVKRQQLIMQIILLAITLARFKYTQIKDKEEREKLQISYLIKFMAEELKSIFLRELLVAINFLHYENYKHTYSDQNKYKFFNKLSTQTQNSFFKALDNMAWDFILARQLEMYFSSKPNPDADFFVPFLFTYDQGLTEVMETFYCKDFLIFHRDKRSIPIPVNDIDMSKLKEYDLEKYFTEDAHINRMNSDEVDFEKVYSKLKEEVIVKRKFK